MLAAERVPRTSGCARSSRSCSAIASAAGPRACPVDQLLLGLEEAEQIEAEDLAEEEAADPASAREPGPAKRRANRGALPAHLPRIETWSTSRTRPARAARRALHLIGEDVIRASRHRAGPVPRDRDPAAEICLPGLRGGRGPGARAGPARRGRHARPRRPSPTCSSPSTPTTCRSTGRPRSIARQGVEPGPLDPGRLGRQGRLPAAARARAAARRPEGVDRSSSPTRPRRRCSIPGAAGRRPASSGPTRATTGPGAAPTRPASPTSTRPTARPSGRCAHLAGFEGMLQVDGYAGYKVLAERNAVRLAFCWATSGAGSTNSPPGGPAPIATEALARIAALYRIEGEIRGRSAEERRAVRQERSRPLVEALEPWLARQARASSARRASSPRRSATRLSRWAGPDALLEDGRVEIDSNIGRARPSGRSP